MVGEQDRQGLAPAPYWSKAAAAPLLVPSSSHDSWAAGWRCSSPAWTARTTRYRRYCGCCWRRGLGQPSSSACWSSTPMGEPPAALRRATRGAALLQRVRVLQVARGEVPVVPAPATFFSWLRHCTQYGSTQERRGGRGNLASIVRAVPL